MRTGPIGFIGTGRMGTPMAEHLLAGGQTLVVHDARRAAVAPLLDQGAQWADFPAEVARRAKTVITIVPASREVEAVVGAMLPVLGHEHLLIEMTSADPSSTRHLAKEVEARGARMIDAPVSGGVGGARRASLAIMVGGAVADFDRARASIPSVPWTSSRCRQGARMPRSANFPNSSCRAASTPASRWR